MAFNFTMKSKTAEATLSLSTEVLSTFLSITKPLLLKKSSVPILKYAHIFFVNGKGHIRLTDSEMFAEMRVTSTGTGEINLAVEYATLESVASKAPKGVFLVERENNKLTFKMNLNTFGSVEGTDGLEYPTYSIDGKPYAEIHLSEFDNKFVDEYMSPLCKKDSQYAGIGGVLTETGADGHAFATTDRNMLVCTRFIIPEKRCVIPPVAFKIVSDYGQPSVIKLSDSGYCIESGNLYVCGKYLDGVYPDIRKLTYTEFAQELKVDVGSFTEKLGAILATAKHYKGMCPVMITFGEEYLGVSEVPDDYVYGKSGIKMDGERILALMKRFDVNSSVTFKSSSNRSKPTLWIDSKATTLFMPLL